MASGSDCRAEDHPPALPIKQHRHSSVESDFVVLSNVGFLHHKYEDNDVFPGPTDCHAAQCPIHQRYDPFGHQARFFSDDIPPPVPKKRLARTLSLPGPNIPSFSSLSPFSPLQRHPQNFDNPLYMMAPIPDTFIQEETEGTIKTMVPVESLSQLSFDTPDEHLPHIFSTLVDHSVVSQGIQHRHLLFLRSVAQNVEAKSLLQGDTMQEDISLYQPQDFLLREGTRPKRIGNMIYYSVQSPKFPGRELGLTVQKETKDASKYKPPHVNVQDVIVRFQPINKLKINTSTVQNPDPTAASQPSHCSATEPPSDGSTESGMDFEGIETPTAHLFLQKGHSVRIERDLPQSTLEDFVLHRPECVDYDRQVCVLLLQVLMATLHLYKSSETAAELRPQEVLLVWDKLQQSGSKGRRSVDTRLQEEETLKGEGAGMIEMFWRVQGSPRVILKPQPHSPFDHQPLHAIKHQIATLLQFCLTPQDRIRDSLLSQTESLYRRCLLHFSSLLQKENGPQMTDVVDLIQVLLWGPRVALDTHTAAHNWLTVKRALLVMKMAERGLVQDESALCWEDWLCLRYLSFTNADMIVKVSGQLWLNTL